MEESQWLREQVSSYVQKFKEGTGRCYLLYLVQDLGCQVLPEDQKIILDCFNDGIEGAKEILLILAANNNLLQEIKDSLKGCANQINIDDFAPLNEKISKWIEGLKDPVQAENSMENLKDYAGCLDDNEVQKLADFLKEGVKGAGELLYEYLLVRKRFYWDMGLVDCLRSEKEEVRKWAKKLLLKHTNSGGDFSVLMYRALLACLEDGIEETVDIWLACINNGNADWSDKFISSLRKGVNGADKILLCYVQQDFKYVRDPLESIISCFKDGIKGAKAILLAYITFHGVSNEMKEALTECANQGMNIEEFAPYM